MLVKIVSLSKRLQGGVYEVLKTPVWINPDFIISVCFHNEGGFDIFMVNEISYWAEETEDLKELLMPEPGEPNDVQAE